MRECGIGFLRKISLLGSDGYGGSLIAWNLLIASLTAIPFPRAQAPAYCRRPNDTA